MKYGERLKKARKTRGLSQAELAEQSGVKQGSISKIERGDQEASSFDIDLAMALQISPVWLSKGLGEMELSNLPTTKPESNAEHEPPRPPVIDENEWHKLPKSQAKSVFDLYQLYAKDIDPSDVVMIKGIIDMMQMKYKDKENDDSTVG